MKASVVLTLVILPFLLLSGCRRHNQMDTAQARLLQQTDQAFSAASVQDGFASAFSRYALDDALLLPQGQAALKGKPEIAQSLAAIPAGTKLSWTPQDAEVSGTLGYSWGIYTLTGVTTNGQTTVAYGKYLSVWERRGGHWKLTVMMTNQSPGPAG